MSRHEEVGKWTSRCIWENPGRGWNHGSSTSTGVPTVSRAQTTPSSPDLPRQPQPAYLRTHPIMCRGHYMVEGRGPTYLVDGAALPAVWWRRRRWSSCRYCDRPLPGLQLGIGEGQQAAAREQQQLQQWQPMALQAVWHGCHPIVAAPTHEAAERLKERIGSGKVRWCLSTGG